MPEVTKGVHLDVVRRWIRQMFVDGENFTPKANIKLSVLDYLLLAQEIRNSVLKDVIDKVYICDQYTGHNGQALCRNCSMPSVLHNLKKELCSGHIHK